MAITLLQKYYIMVNLLDGDFGDTNGKGYVCDVWDY